MQRMLVIVALMSAAICLAGTANAERLPAPTGDVVLTVTGEFEQTNTDGALELDLAALQGMAVTTFTTTTPWTEGPQEFTGVSLANFVAVVGVDEGTLVATAVNDYAVDVPVSDAVAGGPIIAYLQNGAEMSVRDKGPLWIVYPYDAKDEYRTETIYSRSIWQLDRIRVSK